MTEATQGGVAMQHRTPSPNTQSGASVKIKAVFNVLSKLFLLLRACFIPGRRPKKEEAESPPYNNHGDIGFGSCGRALHVLKSGDLGANVGAFAEHAAIPPRAPGARLTRGVS